MYNSKKEKVCGERVEKSIKYNELKVLSIAIDDPDLQMLKVNK